VIVILRCVLDGLLLPAELRPGRSLVAYDGAEAFRMEAVEAMFYELVSATPCEVAALQRYGFRLLRLAEDFETPPGPG
jgi:hypothetical protein